MGIGNLVADPIMKSTVDGKPYARFRIAINQGYGDKSNTTFMSCSVFGRLAEIVEKYTQKGSKIGFNGRMQVMEYEDKNGVKRKDIEVTISDMEMLNGFKTKESERPAGVPKPPKAVDEFEGFDNF